MSATIIQSVFKIFTGMQSTMKLVHTLFIFSFIVLLSACATTPSQQGPTPLDALKELSDPQILNNNNAFMRNLYTARTWVPAKQLDQDPIELSKQSKSPINQAHAKIIGSTYTDALHSLAAKLWMIEHAEHTLDLTYYIYHYDLVGYAVAGALCNAVKRGVDIRIMVDSLGSLNTNHAPLRALETCAEDAGYIRDINGKKTAYKARVQLVIINALTSWSSWSNRRSHDKLIIKDGSFPGKDMVMTGGRNIALDYYGINKDGSKNPDTYMDLEILLRSIGTSRGGKEQNEPTVGDVSSIYYTLLFLHKGNNRIYPISNEDDGALGLLDPYAGYRKKAQEALAFIKKVPAIKEVYAQMPAYLSEGYRTAYVRLSHQLGNLQSENVVEDVAEIQFRNTNSISAIFVNTLKQAAQKGHLSGTIRIISPYLFITQYKDKEGKIFHDGAKVLLNILEENPDLSVEIITNSVLTSDNYFTQSVIDMDTAPRLLLTEDMQKTWLKSRKDSEFNPEFVNSEEWRRLINNPRIRIYETGLLDSDLIGGPVRYGKLHAKTFFVNDFGFVGTSNFDYRSRLYNNELGFYYLSQGLSNDLNQVFDELKAISLRWGTPEWLEMRRKLIESGGFKGYTAGTQRGRYKIMKNLGLIWFF
jgi:putative cardiolipin synthase